jgi:hypothetical protein
MSGVKFYHFGPEEHLLYLSAHLVNSGAFRQLRHVCDIERLIARYGGRINWDSVVCKAREWRMAGSLYAAMVLVRGFSGIGLPWKRLGALKISLPKRLLIRFFAKSSVVLREGLRRRLLDIFLSYIFLEMVEATSVKDYLEIARRVLFPPRESMAGRGHGPRIARGAVKMAKELVA